MPNMANIVVEDAGTDSADVTYSAVVASAGDRSEALWRATAIASTPALQPYLRVRSRYNGPKTTRIVEGDFGFYSTYTDSSTGRVQSAAKAVGTFSFTQPMDSSSDDATRGATHFGNLLASELIKSVNASGFAPT